MRSGRAGRVDAGPTTASVTTTAARTPEQQPKQLTGAADGDRAGERGARARAMFTVTPVMATAGTSIGRGARSGTIAENAGRNIASPAPRTAVAPRTIAGVTRPATVGAARAEVAATIDATASTSIQRRSTTSAPAPAKSASSTPGRLIAVWMAAISAGDPPAPSMTATAPTVWAQITTWAPRKASHRIRKRR